MLAGLMLFVVISAVHWGMIIISLPWPQRFWRYAQSGSKCLEHGGRWGAEAMLDLGEIRVGDPGHRGDLTHRQLGDLSLPTDEFAYQILR
jgi:hypothetical protein